MTVQFLRWKARAVAQRFLYVPLPDFGCPLTGPCSLHGFKMLQPVAERPQVDALLQLVTNLLRTVTTKKYSAVSVRKPLCQDLQIEGAIRR